MACRVVNLLYVVEDSNTRPSLRYFLTRLRLMYVVFGLTEDIGIQSELIQDISA